MPGISWQQRFSTWHFLSMLLVCRWMTGLSSCRSIVANGMRRLQESDGLGMCLPSIQRAGCLRLKRKNRIGMQKLQNMAPGYHHVPWDIMGPCDHRMSVSSFCEPEGRSTAALLMDELRQATHGKQILISVGVTSNKCNLRMGKTLYLW